MPRLHTAQSFESRRQPLLPRRQFYNRLVASSLASALIVALALSIGTAGYHFAAGLGWIDALLNAAMILTGMGPVDHLEGNAAKLFAAAYALFSGVAFLGSIGILIAPVAHRFLHRFHLEADPEDR